MRLSVLLMAVLSLGLLASCPGMQGGTKYKKHSPVVSGNTVTLPAELQIVKTIMAEGASQPVFTAFDGNYPSGWPDALKLPENSYLIDNGTIFDLRTSGVPLPYGVDLAARIMVKQQPARIVGFHKEQLTAAGFEVHENIIPLIEGDDGMYVSGQHQLVVASTEPNQNFYIRVSINEDPGLKDWTNYSIYVKVP